jgi:hypothetical protein
MGLSIGKLGTLLNRMGINKIQRELVLKKQRNCFKDPCIETNEVLMIVSKAWKKLFARVAFNKDAIAA